MPPRRTHDHEAGSHSGRIGARIISERGPVVAQEMQGQYVQLAAMKIDPARLEDYKAAVKEQIETAIRTGPGVPVLYAVAEKTIQPMSGFSKSTGIPMHTRHIWNPLISRNYKTTADKMVKSLKLVETASIMLGAK
jgi:hypothetical protein